MHLCVYEYNTTTLTIGIENGNSETVDLSSLEDGVGITSAQASAITANTAKTRITSSQASAITANTAKTGITSSQASAITANTAKVGMTLGTTSSTALAGDVQIGNSASDKIGFFGASPYAQPTVETIDVYPCNAPWNCGKIRDNRDKINELITQLQTMGLIN